MINTLRTFFFTSTLAIASTAHAEKMPLPANDAHYACIENTMLLSDAQSFLNNTKAISTSDKKIIISFGYTSSYVTAQEAIVFYTERSKHLTQVSNILGCDRLQHPPTTKTAWK